MALFSYLRYVHFVQKFPGFGQRGTGFDSFRSIPQRRTMIGLYDDDMAVCRSWPRFLRISIFLFVLYLIGTIPQARILDIPNPDGFSLLNVFFFIWSLLFVAVSALFFSLPG
jgi:hypothetical protein